MKISVIIPAYNEEVHIGDALTALLAQDHPDFEVIVIDNGSKDRTVNVARSFPVKVVYEYRKGTMWACERGRQGSIGDIIVRMDADCLPEKGWLSQGVDHFKDNAVVAVSGPYDYYDHNRLFRNASLLTQKYVYSPINKLLQVRKKGGTMTGGNSFFRARALKEAGGFNTDIVFYGDETEMAKRISKFGRIVFDTSLTMKTSARRFKSEGVIPLTARYWKHFLKHTLSPNKKTAQTNKAA